MPASGGFGSLRLVLVGGEGGVGGGSQGVDRPVGGGWQLLEKPVQIGAGIDSPAQTAAQQAVEDGGSLTRPRISDKHPVLPVMRRFA